MSVSLIYLRVKDGECWRWLELGQRCHTRDRRREMSELILLGVMAYSISPKVMCEEVVVGKEVQTSIYPGLKGV